MKRCPFCAEEIQDGAIYCRYCHKKITGIWARRIITIVFISAVVVLFVLYHAQIKHFARRIQLFFSDLDMVWQYIKDILKNMKDGLIALKEQRNKL